MYSDMADGKADLSVSIIYDTMWHSTEMMTVPIMEGIKDEGVACKVVKSDGQLQPALQLKNSGNQEEPFIGTPTINNVMFPSVAEFLYHVGGLRPKNSLWELSVAMAGVRWE